MFCIKLPDCKITDNNIEQLIKKARQYYRSKIKQLKKALNTIYVINDTITNIKITNVLKKSKEIAFQTKKIKQVIDKQLKKDIENIYYAIIISYRLSFKYTVSRMRRLQKLRLLDKDGHLTFYAKKLCNKIINNFLRKLSKCDLLSSLFEQDIIKVFLLYKKLISSIIYIELTDSGAEFFDVQNQALKCFACKVACVNREKIIVMLIKKMPKKNLTIFLAAPEKAIQDAAKDRYDELEKVPINKCGF